MRQWPIMLFLAICIFAVRADETQQPDTPDAEAVAAQAAIERPPLPARHQQQLQRLQHAYPDEYRPLTSAFDEAGALYLSANHNQPKGWIILAPGSGQPADANFNINRLRQSLPDSGWHTLSLQLPEPEFTGLYISPPPVPEQEASTPDHTEAEPAAPGNNAAPHNEAPVDTDIYAAPDEPVNPPPADLLPSAPEAHIMPDYGQRMLALLDAAIDMAQQTQPDHLVLLGQHESAYWIAQLIAAEEKPVDALILLHARMPAAGVRQSGQINNLTNLPTADYFDPRNTEEAATARLRLQASRRNPASQYRQTALQEPASALREDEVLRRIKGWLIRLDAR